MQIVTEYSAVASRPAPRSIRRAAPELAKEAERVADVGCGYLAGTTELLRYHRKVYAVDSARQCDRIQSGLARLAGDPAFGGFVASATFRDTRLRLGGAYVVNVLHTLPTRNARIELLEAVRQNLRKTGFALLDVPYYEHYYAGRMTSENRYGDGYVFTRGGGVHTFYRFTTTEELDEWAYAAGFCFERRFVDNHHHVRLYRPT